MVEAWLQLVLELGLPPAMEMVQQPVTDLAMELVLQLLTELAPEPATGLVRLVRLVRLVPGLSLVVLQLGQLLVPWRSSRKRVMLGSLG